MNDIDAPAWANDGTGVLPASRAQWNAQAIVQTAETAVSERG